MRPTDSLTEPSLGEIARERGRIGCIGFGGPPAHVALFRELCVTREEWLSEDQFERAIAATNILPGPASTQLAIYCAWRLRGTGGALIGGLGFILPGLVLILALSVLFLAGSPPTWIRGAGMGAGAAVAPVAVTAGLGVALPIWRRTTAAKRPRILIYALAGAIAAATTGPWLVLVTRLRCDRAGMAAPAGRGSGDPVLVALVVEIIVAIGVELSQNDPAEPAWQDPAPKHKRACCESKQAAEDIANALQRERHQVQRVGHTRVVSGPVSRRSRRRSVRRASEGWFRSLWRPFAGPRREVERRCRPGAANRASRP